MSDQIDRKLQEEEVHKVVAENNYDDAHEKEEDQEKSEATTTTLPDGCVAYTGNPQQLLDRKVTDPQIIVPTDVFAYQPLNPGILIPTFMGDPEELAKIRPPAVVQKIEDRRAELKEEELKVLGELRAHCEEKGYSTTDANDWMLIRYCIARKFEVKKAAEMLDATMKWRQEKTAETSLCNVCRHGRPEAHCLQFIGWDLQHRPVMYSSHRWALGRGVLKDDVAHVIDSYDHAETRMSEGVTQWIAMVDFITYGHWKDGSPAIGKAVGGLLQNHYPERLAMQVLIDPPTTFWVLWKVLSAFIDPKTKSKVLFWYTNQEPNIATEFPKIFPTHLCDWLLKTYVQNKVKAKKEK